MEENKEKISSSELKRFEEQHKIVDQIVFAYENNEKGGDELTEKETSLIMDLMQKMQAYGNPPDGMVTEPNLGKEAPLLPNDIPDCNQM